MVKARIGEIMTAEEYFAQHSIDPEFAKKNFGWNWDKEKIIIPVYDVKGKLLYSKYRWLNPQHDKFTYSVEGSHPTLYPIYKLKNLEEVVYAEGEPDVVRLWQEKIPAVTGTSGVSKFDSAFAAHLKNKFVYLCLDTDEAGQKEILKYSEELLKAGAEVKIITLPPEVKDVSEYFTAGHTRADFDLLKNEALTFNQWIIKKNKDLHPVLNGKVFAEVKYPHKKWLVDKLIRASGITLWTGEGGVGKTVLSYTLAKALVEGSRWLNTFDVTKGRVLLLDKENDPLDVQDALKGLGAINEDLFYYATADTFSFVDSGTGQLTEEAKYLKVYCEENQISAVIIDSLVDFYQGEENSANHAALNTNAWKQVFPDIAINIIHHENKPTPNFKKSASARARGSTHLFNSAQGMLSISVLDEDTPTRLKIEHAKVRGAQKRRPFEIDMIIEPCPDDPNETFVSGFKYVGEISEEESKIKAAKDAILKLLSSSPTKEFDSNEITEALSAVAGGRMVKSLLPELRASNSLKWRIDKTKYFYSFSVENFVENGQNFE